MASRGVEVIFIFLATMGPAKHMFSRPTEHSFVAGGIRSFRRASDSLHPIFRAVY